MAKVIRLYDKEDPYYGYTYGIGMNDLSADNVVRQIMEANGEDLEVRIHSCGGYVFDGWAIFNALDTYKGNVTTINDGIAASMASIIFMAGHIRLVNKASLTMVHKPSTYMWNSANADTLNKEANTLDIIQSVLVDVYEAPGVKIAREEIDALINNETYLTPSEAVAKGFATGMIDNGKPKVSSSVKDSIKNADALKYMNSNFLINNNMKEQTKEQLSKATKAINGLINFIKGNYKNSDTSELDQFVNNSQELQDGSSVYFDGELAVGTLVFSDEQMTLPLADGDHILSDGRTISVASGAVTAISDATSSDNGSEGSVEDRVKALENEIKDLKAENALLTNSIEKSNKVLAALEKIKSGYKPEDKSKRPTNQERNEATAEDEAARFKARRAARLGKTEEEAK